MYPPSREQYDTFLTSEWGVTEYYAFYLDDQLLAVSVADHMESGLSAIYTFYDPSMDKRSLGVFVVLWLIEQAKTLQLPALYLGYWIKHCKKMSYKSQYRPMEIFINGRWLDVL